MLWRTRFALAAPTHATILRRGITSLFLLLSLGAKCLWAQTTIYTWTDEKGVVHYSDSMVPPQHLDRASAMVVPSHPAPHAPASGEPDSIPLVILNNDPSQKFVRAVLEGGHLSREVLMLVDTGAQITLVDEALAEELALEHVQDAILVGVTGAAQSWIGRLPALRVGAEEVRDLPVMVSSLSGRLLLGMDVLERLNLSVGPRSLHQARQ
jgi:hypothetical protein